MKHLKLIILAIMLCAFVVSLSTPALAQSGRDEQQICSDMTYAQLAGIVIKILEIPLPGNFVQMPEEKQFEVNVNQLAEAGVPDFQGTKPNGKVTRGFAAEVLFKVIDAPGDIQGADDKVSYLANLGYISRGGVEEFLTNCDENIAQAYTPPPPPDFPDQPEDDPEDPASDVQ